MEPIKLQVGICKFSSLAEWFGITKNYLSKKKKEKLEELKEFCDYEIVDSTRINILNVKFDIYEKKPSVNLSKVIEEVPKYWGKKNNNNLDTSKRVSEEIYDNKKENNITLSEGSIYSYTCSATKILYGKRNSNAAGTLGISNYVWAKRSKNGGFEYLSTEEEEVKKQLIIKYFGDTEEKALFIQDSIDKGELKEEEAWGEYSKMIKLKANYNQFLSEFKKITGVQLIKCTEIIPAREF